MNVPLSWRAKQTYLYGLLHCAVLLAHADLPSSTHRHSIPSPPGLLNAPTDVFRPLDLRIHLFPTGTRQPENGVGEPE